MTRGEFWMDQYNRRYDLLIKHGKSEKEAMRVADFHATRVTNEVALQNLVPWELQDPED